MACESMPHHMRRDYGSSKSGPGCKALEVAREDLAWQMAFLSRGWKKPWIAGVLSEVRMSGFSIACHGADGGMRERHKPLLVALSPDDQDRKSTRLNSSH